MSFVHLHVHSTYSLLDGFSDLKKLTRRVKEMEMPAIALTDHGTMFGVIEFYNAAINAGIKPIIGLEAYMAARGMHDRDAKLDKQSSHLLLLAENMTGYRNLLAIASAAQLEGFYYFPRIDHDFLAQHSEGLICTSGCMAAEIPRTIANQGADAARAKLDWYYDVFGKDNFFIELQQHNIKELPEINRALMGLGKRYEARYVATNDVHYINPNDARLQDILLAIQTGSVLSDPNRFRMTDDSYYLRTPQEMQTLFAEAPEALENTLLIAERCNVDLHTQGYHLPLFSVPEGYTPESYLREKCEQGLLRRYGPRADDPAVRQRLDYELKIIHQMGFDTYFLIVWDLCRYAAEQGIWYNARGSAAGSIVAYTLDITLVEPIEHGLIFERFLNPGRISMPDIDLDFRDDMRARMMQYCAEKYGQDKVAQIITFGTMGARAAIRDVGRVMDIPITEVDRVAKLIPNVPGKPVSISEALEENTEFKQLYESTGYIKDLIDTAGQMEGTVRSAGTHAAGVIITDQPITEYVPLHRPTSASDDNPIKIVTQFEMSIVESLGLLKVDFLGLITLTVMARACELIRQRHGVDLNLSNIPTGDPATYEFIGSGHTAGVFQLEGTGMTRYITQMKPTNLANVIAMVALYRPGPLEFIPTYIRRMHGEEEISYRDKSLEPIFRETYGIPIYQEQIMFAAMDIAGYSAPEADDLRKAIAKKKADQIAKHRDRFIQGAVERGMAEETARLIFEDWENFARYGFNKSHAADYGVIAVQTAYLKAHYTVEYLTALLSASKNDSDKVALYVTDARSMGIEVLPPDVNAGVWDFSIEDRGERPAAIRFGLGAVKNVGQAPVEAILKAREEGPFSDLTDLASRVDLRQVGKRALESLIRVGALDGFGARTAMLQSLERILSVSAAHFRAAEAGQMSFFGGTNGMSEEITLSPVANINLREQLTWERELLGMYISDHPLSAYMPALQNKITHFSAQLGEAHDKEAVVVAGMVVRVRPYQTRAGKPMGFVTLEDIQGNIELVLFPRTWEKYAGLFEVDKVLSVEGKVDAQGSEPKILVDKVAVETPGAPAETGGKMQTAPAVQQVPPPAAPAMADEGPDWPDEAANPGEPSDWMDSSIPPEPADWDMVAPPPDTPADAWTPPTAGQAAVVEVQALAAPVAETSGGQEIQVAAADSGAVRAAESGAAFILAPFLVPAKTTPGQQDQPRMLTIDVRSSGDKKRDVLRLRCIHGALVSNPGQDHFAFHIFEGGRGYVLEFPNETSGVTPELWERLVKLAGEENLHLEPIQVQ